MAALPARPEGERMTRRLTIPDVLPGANLRLVATEAA